MMQKTISLETIEQFEKQLISDEKSKATIEKYIRDVKALMNYIKGQTLTKEVVIAYKNKLIAEQYAVRSINSMLSSINSLFDFLEWNELKVKNIKIQHQIFSPEEKELRQEDFRKLVQSAERKKNDRLSMIIQTIGGTGIRISELSSFTVEAVKIGTVIITCKGKNRKVLIIKKLREKLLLYAKRHNITHGQIFLTKSGKPIDRSNIWREMKALCKDTGINPKKIFPHNIRHLFARMFYKIEKDIAKLADILGHSSINTTRIYIISTGEEHRKQLELMRLII